MFAGCQRQANPDNPGNCFRRGDDEVIDLEVPGWMTYEGI